MKICFDPTPTISCVKKTECGENEEYREVREDNAALSQVSLVGQREFFLKCRLQLVEPLYKQACGQDWWLVCHPTGQGRIAVLDYEALSLLEQFQEPAMFEDVLHRNCAWPPEALQELLTSFYDLGFLYEYGKISLPIAEAEPQTLTAWLHVTNACNLRCSYCYIQKTQEQMAEDTVYKAIDAIVRSALKHQMHAIHLKYAGGEASLHMSGVAALHDYACQQARQHGIALSATLLSNGMFLSAHSIEYLQTRQIGVTISLDGIGEYNDNQRVLPNGKGSFKYIQRTIGKLLDQGLVPHISVTVSQRNLAGLPQLMQYLLDHQLTFSLNYYRAHTNVPQGKDFHFEEQAMASAMRSAMQVIEQQLPRYSLLGSLLDKGTAQTPHQYTCGVGRNYLVIDQRGGVAKCQADIARNVTTIASDDPLQVILEDKYGVQNVPVHAKAGCRSCTWRNWCTGGCPLLTYQVTGRNDVQSPNCNIYQALYPDVVRLEALRLLAYQMPVSYEKISLAINE